MTTGSRGHIFGFNSFAKRGGATNATQAVVVSGRFKLTGYHIAGFDEQEGPAKSARMSR